MTGKKTRTREREKCVRVMIALQR